jgi:F0F1-type ATP synthase membrane subunit a
MPIFALNAVTQTTSTDFLTNFSVSSNNAQSFLSVDPLEQFEVTSLFTMGAVSTLTNLGFIMALNVILMAAVFASYNFNLTNNYDFATRTMYQLVQSMVKENLYIRKQQYFSVLFYLFVTLLFANLIGLLPYSFTITSSFIVTLFISLTHFVGVNTIGASQHG